MKILVGDVAFGDVVFRVRRGFAIPSLSIIYANSFVYHLGLQTARQRHIPLATINK